MLIRNENLILAENMNRTRMQILTCGHAIVDHDNKWKGLVLTPSFSRLYYILDGEFFLIEKDGTERTLRAGNYYLLPAGYSFDFGCREYMEHLYFHVKLCGIDELDLLKHCSTFMELSFPEESKEYYVSIFKSQNILNTLQAQHLVYHSVSALLEKYQVPLKPAEYSPQVLSAIEYIKNHLSIQLSLEEIAASTYTAVSTLTRKFRQETGMSIGQYIDDAVLFRAEQLLISSNMSILEISEQFGFCDQFYFTRRFHEKYLMSPRDYRKLTII